MQLSAYIARWRMLTGLPVLRHVPFVRDLPFVRGHFRFRGIEMPREDRERLSAAVNPHTAAIIAPNHPEFGCDWMLDKELSSIVAPRMASWADRDVVRTAPAFWRRQHLISNDGGEHAIDYSVRCALRGDGVLLHPEGSVHWTANRVHPLYRGIVEIALEAARRADGRPVFIVPVVWKYFYLGDVSNAILGELATLERALGVPCREELDVAERFHALQESALSRQMARFGYADRDGGDFFTRQEAFRDALIEDLARRYAVERTGSVERDILRFKKAINAAKPRSVEDLAMAAEALRLNGFTRADYGTLVLTQEQIHESLKRLRAGLVRRGWRQVVHNLLPKPFGPRVAHIRVPEPIRVDPSRANQDDYPDHLLELTRKAMQQALDAIQSPYAGPTWPNPFGARFPNPSGGWIVSRKGRCQASRMTADLADPPPLSRTG